MNISNIFRKLLYEGGIFFDLARWAILIAIILTLVSTFLVSIFIVDGISMEPNLHNREIVLYQRNSYTGNKNPQRGDVAVVRYPGDPDNKRYVKRVVGLPGELVEVKNEHVYINNKQFSELYIAYDVPTEPDGRWQLKAGEYFLMGDNRPNSNDSRYFGPVEKRFLAGKAIYILFSRFQPIDIK